MIYSYPNMKNDFTNEGGSKKKINTSSHFLSLWVLEAKLHNLKT